MSYVSIMVAADRSEKVTRRYRLARDLSSKFDARLIGAAARMIDTPTMVYGDAFTPLVMPDFQKVAQGDLEGVHAGFMKSMEGCNRVEWRGDIDEPTRFLTRQSRAADLVVVGRRGPDDVIDHDFGVDPGDVVLEAGRPVLVVPPWMNEVQGRRIVVAWSDTREARRAVQDAMPFLRGAEEVCVAKVVPSAEDSFGTRDVVRFLLCHGVRAKAHNIETSDCGEGALLEYATFMGADLIVSGAYGHSRFRETIFGGVTRGLLKHADVCCLMSH